MPGSSHVADLAAAPSARLARRIAVEMRATEKTGRLTGRKAAVEAFRTRA